MNLPDAFQFAMAVQGYVAADEDTSGTTQYYGFIDRVGNWYILAQNISVPTLQTFRYIRGSSGYTTNWTARAALVYDYYYNIFNTSI